MTNMMPDNVKIEVKPYIRKTPFSDLKDKLVFILDYKFKSP